MIRDNCSSMRMIHSLTNEDLDSVAGGNQNPVNGSFNCPHCGGVIHTTMMELLYTTGLTCPTCKTHFPIDCVKHS